ncbi:cupin domain-containing protein [Desulforhopalus singaporensis]|uniref:Cupin domain-containing protein n=1 Tax=Desulforhopalus singaporensis TaxID=91360 RepID=A0A1H0SLD9_9BACT|nr:hypothetical protein [Desulforhopalus singaporensis]SDP42359.1 hypothetical protein SAMN05660330_02732 [Desulforhopalus singaporensis]
MGKHDRLIVREPKVVCVDYHPVDNVKGVTFPDEIWLDNTIVKNSPVVVDIGWRFEVPEPDPVEWEHSHEFDEVLCFIGTDPENPRDLGGEIEFHIDGEVHVFDTTTVIFLPKGLPHCPFVHKRVDRPFLLVVFALDGRYPEATKEL